MAHTEEVLDLTKGVIDLAGALGSLLLKLGKLLRHEYELQAGVKEDVEDLVRELGSIHAALRKVGGVPRDQLDEQVKLWADEVRDMSYQMEDVVDKFLVHVEDSKPAERHNMFVQFMKNMCELFTKGKTRREISNEIKSIKARIQETACRHGRYWVDVKVVNPVIDSVDPRLMVLRKGQKELVGIDRSLSKLTKMFTDDDGDVSNGLKVLSIFGLGGLGKTTLAQALYDKIQARFDGAFVPVGRNPSANKVLTDIILQIDERTYQESNLWMLDERQLITKLRRLLENKRYLIVLDDVWDTKLWEILMCALEHNSCASRIIITTRILQVATETGEVYRLEPLSRDSSKQLLDTRLFGDKSKHSYDVPMEVYDKILHKCGGVPLAITTIASLLVDKPEVKFWYTVYNAIGFGNEDNKHVNNTRKILLFSYYDLPCHLRTCLLYLSMYPEDHFIAQDLLIWKWIAEGFVCEEPGVTLYEIGERYFNELINKSLIEPVENIVNDGIIIIGCRVHDIVFDMIRVLAKEDNFITVLDSNEKETYSVHSNIRRLAVGHENHRLKGCMLQVRSFNAFGGDAMLPILSCFEVLRVLDLEDGINFCENNTNCLENLGKLVHLRYLGLGHRVKIRELPMEIGVLRFLQTLYLSCDTLRELPRSVGLLSQLKNLHAVSKHMVMPDWIGSLTSLQDLRVSQVHESSNFMNELGKLTELRKLRISAGCLWLFGSRSMKAWAWSLSKLQKIQHIDILLVTFVGYDVSTDHWLGYKIPRHMNLMRLWYRQPGLVAPGCGLTAVDYEGLFKLVKTEIFGKFPELFPCRLTLPRGGCRDVMGAKGALSMLRVCKRANPVQFVERDIESLDFSINVRPSIDGKVDDLDMGSLEKLPLLQIMYSSLWTSEHKI